MTVVAPEERPRERRIEILDAARELFFAEGYSGTSVQQIAARAGYSKRTLYLDYLNKDELFVTICAEGAGLLRARLEAVDWEALTIDAAFERLVDIYVGFSREHWPYFRMLFGEATPAIVAHCSPGLRERVRGIERAAIGVLVAWAERAMREGRMARMDAWEAAGLFVGSATGIILLSMGASQTVFSRERLEAMVRKAVETLWRGLSQGAAGGEP